MGAQVSRQIRSILRDGILLQHHISDEASVPRNIFPGQHLRLAHPWMLTQADLDLSRLDAKAADLQLLIVAAEELQIAIREIARQIPGAIHTGARLGVERIAEETLGGQLRTMQIAARNTRAPDVQLADRSLWHQLSVCIEQV